MPYFGVMFVRSNVAFRGLRVSVSAIDVAVQSSRYLPCHVAAIWWMSCRIGVFVVCAFLLSLNNFFRFQISLLPYCCRIGIHRMVGYDFLGVELVDCRDRETVVSVCWSCTIV